jgi:two-component system chemotaxis response regulator CheY
MGKGESPVSSTENQSWPSPPAEIDIEYELKHFEVIQGSFLGAKTMPVAAVLKILVVDDQNSVRQMTRITLEQIGIRHIHEAENGKQAMTTASLQPLDLIISDYNMPEMDGLALLRAVRGHPAARKVPFILLTGRGDRELVVQAAQAGANNYLIKPFTADILRQKIEQVMGKLT